jgi:hypothetical protein
MPNLSYNHVYALKQVYVPVWLSRHFMNPDHALCYKAGVLTPTEGIGDELVQVVAELEQQGVAFESLTEKIETSSAAGKLVFHVFAALAEFERNLIRERTHAGLAAARARGRKGGRKPALTPQQVREIKALLRDPSIPVASIADRYGVSRATIYKHAGADAPARHQSGPSSGPAKGANRV